MGEYRQPYAFASVLPRNSSHHAFAILESEESNVRFCVERRSDGTVEVMFGSGQDFYTYATLYRATGDSREISPSCPILEVQPRKIGAAAGTRSICVQDFCDWLCMNAATAPCISANSIWSPGW